MVSIAPEINVVAATGVPLGSFSVVTPNAVLGVIVSSKEIEIALLTGTPVASRVGSLEIITGAIVSTLNSWLCTVSVFPAISTE